MGLTGINEKFNDNRLSDLFTPAQKRDAKIKKFLEKAGIFAYRLKDTEKGGMCHIEKEGGSQRLYKDEIFDCEGKNADNIQAKTLDKFFANYTTGKDDDGISYMTVDDLVKFIEGTDSGKNEPKQNLPVGDKKKESKSIISMIKDYVDEDNAAITDAIK